MSALFYKANQDPRNRYAYCKPIDMVHLVMSKVMKRASRMGLALWRDDVERHATKVCKRTSAHPSRTLRSFMDYMGYGRYKNNAWDIHSYQLEHEQEIHSSLITGQVIKGKKELKHDRFLMAMSDIIADFRYTPYNTRRHTVTALSCCHFCNKLFKTVNFGEGWTCKSCTAKEQHIRSNELELAEVNRLTHKLKRVIKDESKRLEKEAY